MQERWRRSWTVEEDNEECLRCRMQASERRPKACEMGGTGPLLVLVKHSKIPFAAGTRPILYLIFVLHAAFIFPLIYSTQFSRRWNDDLLPSWMVEGRGVSCIRLCVSYVRSNPVCYWSADRLFCARRGIGHKPKAAGIGLAQPRLPINGLPCPRKFEYYDDTTHMSYEFFPSAL